MSVTSPAAAPARNVHDERPAGWNPAHWGAYRKGVQAFRAGQPVNDCPYADHRKGGGQLTWSRSFIRAWEDGWQDARREAETSDD